jgi:hypothetical protein
LYKNEAVLQLSKVRLEDKSQKKPSQGVKLDPAIDDQSILNAFVQRCNARKLSIRVGSEKKADIQKANTTAEAPASTIITPRNESPITTTFHSVTVTPTSQTSKDIMSCAAITDTATPEFVTLSSESSKDPASVTQHLAKTTTKTANTLAAIAEANMEEEWDSASPSDTAAHTSESSHHHHIVFTPQTLTTAATETVSTSAAVAEVKMGEGWACASSSDAWEVVAESSQYLKLTPDVSAPVAAMAATTLATVAEAHSESVGDNAVQDSTITNESSKDTELTPGSLGMATAANPDTTIGKVFKSAPRVVTRKTYTIPTASDVTTMPQFIPLPEETAEEIALISDNTDGATQQLQSLCFRPK